MKDEEPAGGAMPDGAGTMSEDEIDRNLKDTFPASDPPSWTLGINHHEGAPTESEKDDEDEDSR